MNNTAEKIYHEPDSELVLQPGITNIGTAGDNEICITGEGVSDYHARIVSYFHQSFLVDLSSESGTFLNGQRIIKQALKNGDMVGIGPCLYRIKIPVLL